MLGNTCINEAIKTLQSKHLHNSDIRSAISKLQTALMIREAENTNADLLRRYNSYYDDCERCNNIPLPFDKWRATHNN